MSKKRSVSYIHFQTIDSTNTWAKQHAQLLDTQGITCITAEEQTTGRGRFARKWLSPKGQNIYASFYFCLPQTTSILLNVGQVLSISCCKMLQNKGLTPEIKWVNDILLEKKKIAGILCETIHVRQSLLGVILGIGINVNMTEDLLHQIDQPATSLLQETHQHWALDPLLQELFSLFLEDLSLLEEQGFSPFYDYYEKHLAFKESSLGIKDGTRSIEASYEGLTEEGKLLIRLPSGEKQTLCAGEIVRIHS